MLSTRRFFQSFLFIIVFVLSLMMHVVKCPTRESYLHNTDQGYQLAVGVQILHGKVPGVDVLVHYGPMVFYSSALWYRISGSLVGEMVACAVAFAACIALIYALVSRHASTIAGLLAAAVATVLETRYYKWYIWLFPLGTLWLLDRVSESAPGRRSRWVAATGLWVGLGWLFRWDIGTMGAAACLAFFVLTRAAGPAESRPPLGRTWALFLLGFAIPPLAWFGYLLFARGPSGVGFYVWSTIRMTRELTHTMALPLPRFNRSDLLSPASTLVLAYVMVPATYLICGAAGLMAELKGRSTGRSRFLLAVALVGASTFHQAMHRKGGFHLLQVIPPAIIGSCVVISALAELTSGAAASGRRNSILRFLGSAYLVCSVVVALALQPSGRLDLSRFQPWPRQRFRELARPLDTAGDDPLLPALRLARELTDRDDPILVFPIDCQIYALVDRPVSGRMIAFIPGSFGSWDEAEKNLQAIRREMPRLVFLSARVARTGHPPGPASDELWAHNHPYLVPFIEEHYTREIYRTDDLIVLAPEGGAPGPVGARFGAEDGLRGPGSTGSPRPPG